MYIPRRPEANVPCPPQFLSKLFFGTGFLTENLELDLTDNQGPGSSSLSFPSAGDPNSSPHDMWEVFHWQPSWQPSFQALGSQL